MKEDVLKVKVNGNYSNQFVTTIKGNAFYKDKTTDYFGDDQEVEALLSQGILILEDSKELHGGNNMSEENQVQETPVEEVKEVVEEVKEESTEEVKEEVKEEAVKDPQVIEDDESEDSKSDKVEE